MALDEQQRLERAARIRQLREDSPYTQEALAEKIGVKLRSYQKWEEGGGIDWDHLEALAEIHEVPVKWIHKGTTETANVVGALNSDPTAILDEIRRDVKGIIRRLDAAEAARAATAQIEGKTRRRRRSGPKRDEDQQAGGEKPPDG